MGPLRASLLVLAAVLLAACDAAPAATPPLRGVGVHSLWTTVSPDQMRHELDLAQRAGSNVVRVDVTWGSLQIEGRGRFSRDYVAAVDRFVAGAKARGMKVIATLVGTPCWASTAPASRKQGCSGDWWNRRVDRYPPSDPRDYGTAARFLTQRYGTDLAALEVWNEPNLDDASRPWISRDQARDYMRLVRAAYPAAKAGDRRVPVIAGAMSFADRPFLERLYALGLRRHSDGVSVHPYNEWRSPDDRWQEAYRIYTFLPGLEWVRGAMVAAGDSAAKVWITEFGWTTGQGVRWGVTERQQAQYVERAFTVLEKLPWVRAAAVYNLRNKPREHGPSEANFGLVTQEFRAKPAFWALQRALRR